MLGRMARWRKMTWAIWAWSLLCLVWLITGIAAVSSTKRHCNGLSQSACQAATNVGAGIGVTFIVIVWLLVFLVLSLIWFMSRPRPRTCPRCGEDVRKGLTVCKGCGFDFATIGSTAAP